MSPTVQKVFDNGGISQATLAYEMGEGAEEECTKGALGLIRQI
jgi:hypothetical protein